MMTQHSSSLRARSWRRRSPRRPRRSPPAAPLKVVATTEDLASLAREIGGDRVVVDILLARLSGPALRRAEAELHPEAGQGRPAHRRRPRAGDRLAAGARSTQSRNAKIQPGGRGYLDASTNVKILEIPTGQITRAMGDVHPPGNPHYWLDPENGRLIAQAIRDKLTRSAGRRGVLRAAATRTSTGGWPRRRSDGTRRWRRTGARRS